MARTLSGLTPAQEQLYQERQTRIAERRMRGPLAREIYRATVAFGYAEGNPGRQAEVMAGHRDAIADIMQREYEWAFGTFGQRLIDAAQKSHGHLERKDSLFMRFAREWIAATAARKVTAIVGTTRSQAERVIRGAVDRGYQEGLGVDAIGALIRSAVEAEAGALARYRSNVISRTETHAAANAGAHEAARATGLTLQKEWVASADERTRASHAAANGQTVAMNEPFIVGGAELQYPGDMTGPAEEVINCRCASVHVVPE